MPPQQQRRYYNMASRVSHMAGVCHFAGAPNKISVTAVATKICEPRQTLHEFRPKFTDVLHTGFIASGFVSLFVWLVGFFMSKLVLAKNNVVLPYLL